MGYEPPRGRKGRRDSRGSSPRRGSFGDGRKGRGRKSFGRDSSRDRRGPRRELQMTKVTCSACKEECEVPFKPTSTKPVYCRDCFEKKGKGSSGRHSDKHPGRSSDGDLDLINEKLNKIMKALKIK